MGSTTTKRILTQGPGPMDCRQAFPAHRALENVHQLVTPDGTKHLRIADAMSAYRQGGGPDDPLCSTDWRTPKGSRYNIPCRGKEAIEDTTCTACKFIGANIMEDASYEAEDVDRAAGGLKATLSVLRGMQTARGVRS